MKYPEFYYYQSLSDEVTYTHTPQSRMNVQKLIQGRPYWEKSGAKIAKEKTLILSAWSLQSFVSHVQIVAQPEEALNFTALGKIQEWLEAGFKILCWQAGHIIEVTPDFFLPLEFYRRCSLITPAQPDEILRVVKNTLGGRDEQYLLIDNNLLTNPLVLQPNIIDRVDWEDAQQGKHEEMKNFLNAMAQRLNVMPPERLIQDLQQNSILTLSFSCENQLIVTEELKKKILLCNELIVICDQDIKSLPDDAHLRELIAKSQCKSFTIYNCHSHDFEIPGSVKYLFFGESKFKVSYLNKILKNEKLVSLYIKNCSIEFDDILLVPKFLQHFHVDHDEFDGHKWIDLENAKSLIQLSIERTSDLVIHSEAKFVLTNLKSLNVRRGCKLSKIANCFPNLKELIIELAHLEDESFITKFPHLTNLIIDFCEQNHEFTIKETHDVIIKILSGVPNLKYLYFPYMVNYEKLELDFSGVNINLEHLAFSCSDVEVASLMNKSELKVLELFDGYRVQDEEKEKLLAFINDFPNLAVLNCQRIVNQDLYLKLVEKFSVKCKILTIDEFSNEQRDSSFENESSDSEQHSDGNEESSTSVMYLDADTTPIENLQFNAEIIFHPVKKEHPTPSPSEYRDQIFNRLRFNPEACQMSNAFILENVGDHDVWQPCSAERFDGDSVIDFIRGLSKPEQAPQYYAKVNIPPSDEWKVLCSYKPHEVMTHYQTVPNSAQVNIRYKKFDNRYYILNKSAEEIKLIFVIKVPPLPAFSLTLAIQENINVIKNYSSLALENLPPNPTGSVFFHELITQKRGACRHRAVAFMGLTQEQYSVRYVGNTLHAKIELNMDNVWYSIDLGGYPAQVNILKSADTETENTANDLVMYYSQRLQTWMSETSSQSTFFYHLSFLQSNRKRLILTSSKQAAGQLLITIQQIINKCHVYNVCFTARNYDDLISSGPFIRKLDTQGQLVPGPGGALYDFIKNNNFKRYLLVDLSLFSRDELLLFKTAFNSEKPKIDGIPIPNTLTLIVIASIDQKETINDYEVKSELYPFEAELSVQSLVLPFAENLIQEDVYTINLYHSPDWHSRLLGRWVLSQSGLHYEEGELILALQSNANAIEIQNGLWSNEKFIHFWQEAFIFGRVTRLEEEFHIPANTLWYKSEGYPWDKLLSCFQGCYVKPHKKKTVLNQEALNLFLGLYVCDDERHSLHFQEGIIQQHANATVEAYLTSGLLLDQWAMLLTECVRYQVQLFVYCPEEITMPDLFLRKMTTDANSPPVIQQSHTQIIYSNDTDFTTNIIRRNNTNVKVVNVSNCEVNDLLSVVDGKLLEDRGAFYFVNQPSPLLTRLAAGEVILLTGTFSCELIDLLATILIDRLSSVEASGQLILVTEQEKEFAFLSCNQHVVTAEMRSAFVTEYYSEGLLAKLTPSQLATRSFAATETRLRYLQAMPDVSSDIAWRGFDEIKPISSQRTYQLSKSAEVTAEVDRQRLSDIYKTLKFQRFVCLLGLTAVGKTTFIDCVLSKEGKMYFGEASIAEFKNDRRRQNKFLFIDEASLAKLKWSMFEGLINNPPTLFFDELDEFHFIIFADNPHSYGGGRVMPDFFKRHGGAVIFNPLPAEYIYETILKPIFVNTPIIALAETISIEFLKIYTYLLQMTVDEVLITPREIQMMALLTLAHCLRTQMQDDPIKVAKYYGYFVAKELVPEPVRANFENEYAVALPIFASPSTARYLPTLSRMPISILFADLFALRRYRQTQSCNEAQRYGGLGGVLLEGGPGTGKKSLVEHAFENQKFCEGKDFIYLNQSPSITHKREQLDKAFQQGQIILVEKLNASSPMERDFNSYLMGKNVNNARSATPGSFGFFLQYPPESTDEKFSNALRRRLLKVTLPEYTQSELASILSYRGFPPMKIEPLLAAYALQRMVAQRQRLKPAPDLRHLLSLEKKVLNLEMDDELQPPTKKVRQNPSF